MKKMSKNCSTDEGFIWKRNTTYEIGTLALEVDGYWNEKNYGQKRQCGSQLLVTGLATATAKNKCQNYKVGSFLGVVRLFQQLLAIHT